MSIKILLLSGPIGSGKSTVAKVLANRFQYRSISSGDYLRSISLGHSRAELQDVGDKLDSNTDYRWLIDQVAIPIIDSTPNEHRWLLDAIRKARQVEHFRTLFGRSVWHAHLCAPEHVLSERFYSRRPSCAGDYQAAIKHPNEVAARSLSHSADGVYDSSSLTSEQIAELINQALEEG